MKFRKRPVVIEAIQFTESIAKEDDPLPDGVVLGRRSIGPPPFRRLYDYRFYVRTLEGEMDVRVGDWIITGVKGEKYPCKPDIFAMTYEPADKPAPSASIAHEQIPAMLAMIQMGESVEEKCDILEKILRNHGLQPAPPAVKQDAVDKAGERRDMLLDLDNIERHYGPNWYYLFWLKKVRALIQSPKVSVTRGHIEALLVGLAMSRESEKPGVIKDWLIKKGVEVEEEEKP